MTTLNDAEHAFLAAVDWYRDSENQPDEMVCCNDRESICGLNLDGMSWVDVVPDAETVCPMCVSVFLTPGWRCRFCGCTRLVECGTHPIGVRHE